MVDFLYGVEKKGRGQKWHLGPQFLSKRNEALIELGASFGGFEGLCVCVCVCFWFFALFKWGVATRRLGPGHVVLCPGHVEFNKFLGPLRAGIQRLWTIWV